MAATRILGRAGRIGDLGYAAAQAAAADVRARQPSAPAPARRIATSKAASASASVVTADGYTVGALVAVNAVGRRLIGDGPHFWAAPLRGDGEFGGRGWPEEFAPDATALRAERRGRSRAPRSPSSRPTPLCPRRRRSAIAIMAQDGLARALRPAHAPMDGDTVFAAATGAKPRIADRFATDPDSAHAADCCSPARWRAAVPEAAPLPFASAMPSWRQKFARVV